MQKRFRIRSIFTVFLISYFVILILPALLAAGLYRQAFRMAQDKYIETGLGKLARSCVSFDNYIEQLDTASLKLTFDTDLKKVAQMNKPAPGESKVIEIVNFSGRLRNILSSDLDSTYALILEDNEFVFTSTGVIYGLDFFFNKSRTYTGMDAEEWIRQSFALPGKNFLPIQTVWWMGKPVEALTYNRSLGMNSSKGNYKGVVQYLISRSYLEGVFNEVFEEGEGQLCVFSNDGNYLGSIGEAAGQTIGEFPALLLSGQSGSFEQEGMETVSLYQKSANLIFLLNMPRQTVYGDAFRFGFISCAAAAFCVLVELGLGIFFAWRYSTPLKNMLKNIKTLTDAGHADANEYKQLKDGVDTLVRTHQSMQSALAEHQLRERRSVMDQLLSGRFRREEEAREAAQRAGLILGNGPFLVIMMDGSWPQLEKLLQKGREAGCFREAWIDGKVSPVTLVITGVGEKPEWEEGFRVWLRQAEEICAGAGRRYENLLELSLSMQQAQFSLRLARREQKAVHFYGELPREKRELYFPAQLEEKLISGVRHGETAAAEEVFALLEEENLQKRELSGNMMQILLADLTAAFVKVRRDIVSEETQEDVQELIGSSADPFLTFENLKRQFCILCTQVRQNKNDQKELVNKRLLEYLEQHYGDQQLCIAQMAAAFGFSENYFSQFFREGTGEAFSVCLERIRMQKAREYLRLGKEEVESVAVLCGYTNAASFRRAFKRVNGISPSQWKQENR